MNTLQQEAFYYNSVAKELHNDYRKVSELRESCGSWEEAWDTLSRGSTNSPEDAWDELIQNTIQLILKEDPLYPASLLEIPFPPHALYIKGALPRDRSALLAIVGTRKATPEGKELAHEFAQELTRAGLAVVSGLALGIDAAAHAGALQARGKTIAVLAQGLHGIYPPANTTLGKNIIEQGGALVSEYSFGSASLPYRFLERNRIVSGLSRGVLVIEAPSASGSLATARFALDQNRDVFVIPGPINHPNFKGSHQLLRAGATLVTEPNHILEDFNLLDGVTPSSQLPLFDTPEEKSILEALEKSAKALSVDALAEMTNLTIPIVNQTVSFLVIKNTIKETERGYML